LLAVCKVSDPKFDPDGVGPPPEVPLAHQGFSDVIADDDNIIRRQLLVLTPPLTSRCATKSAFSLELTLAYLDSKRIQAKVTPEGYLQLGNVVFKELVAHMGGYQTVDAGGHQVLLNYRPFHSLQDIAAQVTLTDILHDRITPTQELQGRLVLIGVTDPSFGDYWSTPYSAVQETAPQQIPGVFLQAQMVSQLLSAVLDGRPLLWVWPQWGEALWIWGWALVGGLLTWRCRSPLRLGITVGATLSTLYGLCFALLTHGGWVPLVPSALAMAATSASASAYPRLASGSSRKALDSAFGP
jgi:CHASE2 domain-containing sensor protein